jgi:cytochrome c1
MLGALVLGVIFLNLTTGCDSDTAATSKTRGGDPERGKQAIAYHGCGSCHTIPGVRGADALVGPSLERVGGRAYIGGVLQNNPDNLVRWIVDPPAVDPQTAMPNIHVSEADARDIAGYLYTLR